MISMVFESSFTLFFLAFERPITPVKHHDSVVILAQLHSQATSSKLFIGLVRMAASKTKQYLALVTEAAGCTKSEPVAEELCTTAELKVKMNTQKLQLAEMKKKHKEAQAKDKEGKEPRNYKRPPWASASRMKIKMGKKREYVDVEITDNWGEIKQMVCEKMEVQEKDTDMTLSFDMPQSTVKRGKSGRSNPFTNQ